MKRLITLVACLLSAVSIQAREIRIISNDPQDIKYGREIILSLDDNDILKVEYCKDSGGCEVIGSPRPFSEYQNAIQYHDPMTTMEGLSGFGIGMLGSMAPAAFCLIRPSSCRKIMAKMNPNVRDAIMFNSIGLPVAWGVAGAYTADAISGGTVQYDYIDVNHLLEDLEESGITTINLSDFSNRTYPSITDLVRVFSYMEMRLHR